MPRPLHAGDVFRIEPRCGTEQLLGGESLGLGLVLPGECAGIVWSSSCLAAGQTILWGQMGLHWLCSAAWLIGGWANWFGGVRMGGRRFG